MGYITYRAIKYFKEAPDGTRLFYPYGKLTSRPLVVPDPGTEQILFKKQKLMEWILIGLVTCEIIVMQLFYSELQLRAPLALVGFIAIFGSAAYAIHWFVFRETISKLANFSGKLPA